MKGIKLITGLFILVLILIVLAANLGLGPEYFPFIYTIPGLDKVGHFFEKKIEVVAGVLLIAIGIKTLLDLV